MSVIYSFMDDSVYGADDINKTFSKLTTQGVSLFKYNNGDNGNTGCGSYCCDSDRHTCDDHLQADKSDQGL